MQPLIKVKTNDNGHRNGRNQGNSGTLGHMIENNQGTSVINGHRTGGDQGNSGTSGHRNDNDQGNNHKNETDQSNSGTRKRISHS